MRASDAQDLIAGAVPGGAAVWADFGAGEGTFTRATKSNGVERVLLTVINPPCVVGKGYR